VINCNLQRARRVPSRGKRPYHPESRSGVFAAPAGNVNQSSGAARNCGPVSRKGIATGPLLVQNAWWRHRSTGKYQKYLGTAPVESGALCPCSTFPGAPIRCCLDINTKHLSDELSLKKDFRSGTTKISKKKKTPIKVYNAYKAAGRAQGAPANLHPAPWPRTIKGDMGLGEAGRRQKKKNITHQQKKMKEEEPAAAFPHPFAAFPSSGTRDVGPKPHKNAVSLRPAETVSILIPAVRSPTDAALRWRLLALTPPRTGASPLKDTLERAVSRSSPKGNGTAARRSRRPMVFSVCLVQLLRRHKGSSTDYFGRPQSVFPE